MRALIALTVLAGVPLALPADDAEEAAKAIEKLGGKVARMEGGGYRVQLNGPKVTDEAPARFVPVIVTDVPPAVGPAFGVRLVTAGAAM